MARWVGWALATIAGWGIWATLLKLIAEQIQSPAYGQAVSTIGIQAVVLALWMMKDSPPADGGKYGVLLAFGSGIVSCLGNIAYFDLFNRGATAAAVIPITALSPAVTVLLAIPLLNERLNRWQAIGIGLSLPQSHGDVRVVCEVAAIGNR